MKKLSLKTKLVMLFSFLIIVICLEGVVGYVSVDKVDDYVEDLADVQLPATRDISLADMYHDGLRSIAFRALYYSDSKDLKLKQEMAQELKEASTNILKLITDIEKLNVHADTKKTIADTVPEVEAYVKVTEEVVALSLSGRKDLAANKLDDLDKAFSSLEKKLEELNGLLDKDKEEKQEEGKKVSQIAERVNLSLVVFSVLIGFILSYVVVTNLVKTLNLLVSSLSSTSHHVASTSTQIASSSQSLSQATTEQAASLEETAASLEEISAMISKATDSATSTAESSGESQKKAEEGRVAVEQMMTSMDDISQSNENIMAQINESNQKLTEIVQVIQEIGNKTKVINEIVFQTKLLSFNASVEAARAGEHGKGFAVVAEEVGNLAQMSGNAAKEITDMLDNSISKVEVIVNETKSKVEVLVAQGKRKVQSGVDVARQCSEVFNDIVQNVNKVSNLAQDISQASHEQAQGVSEINKAMGQLDTVTQQNASTSEHVASAASNLSSQAMSLKSAVDELVLTVQGHNETMNSTVISETHTTKIEKKKLFSGTKSQSQSDSKVLHLKTKTHEYKSSDKSHEMKLAVGEGQVPSSDDAGFAE